MPDWMKQTTVSIDGMNKGFVDAVQSIHLWEGMMERTVDELPLAVHNFQSLANVLGSDQLSAAAIHSATGGSAVSHAANAAKIAVDGLAASMENAGGKSGAFSQKMLQAAQSMVAMAKQAQDAADKGETVDPKQQVAGMVQIAAAAILTYKERAIVESVYYAAESVQPSPRRIIGQARNTLWRRGCSRKRLARHQRLPDRRVVAATRAGINRLMAARRVGVDRDLVVGVAAVRVAALRLFGISMALRATWLILPAHLRAYKTRWSTAAKLKLWPRYQRRRAET